MNTIYGYFAGQTKLPITIDQLTEQAQQRGGANEYQFAPTVMSPNVLQGLLRKRRVTDHDGNARIIADVAYSASLTDPAMIRLVCAKEVLHSLDEERNRAATREDVRSLVINVVAPEYFHAMMSYLEEITPSGFRDYIGILLAIMVLIPKRARDILWRKYDEGRLSAEDVAQIVEVPPGFVRAALSPMWPKFCGAIQAQASSN